MGSMELYHWYKTEVIMPRKYESFPCFSGSFYYKMDLEPGENPLSPGSGIVIHPNIGRQSSPYMAE